MALLLFAVAMQASKYFRSFESLRTTLSLTNSRTSSSGNNVRFICRGSEHGLEHHTAAASPAAPTANPSLHHNRLSTKLRSTYRCVSRLSIQRAVQRVQKNAQSSSPWKSWAHRGTRLGGSVHAPATLSKHEHACLREAGRARIRQGMPRWQKEKRKKKPQLTLGMFPQRPLCCG
jgi:hypothetical protein